jgi:hypothetical protein
MISSETLLVIYTFLNFLEAKSSGSNLPRGPLEDWEKYFSLEQPEPMIRFSSEAVSDKFQNSPGFGGEMDEVIRSPFLYCNIASLTREPSSNNRAASWKLF